MAPDVLHASGGTVNVSWQVALKTLSSLTLIFAPVTLKLKFPGFYQHQGPKNKIKTPL